MQSKVAQSAATQDILANIWVRILTSFSKLIKRTMVGETDEMLLLRNIKIFSRTATVKLSGNSVNWLQLKRKLLRIRTSPKLSNKVSGPNLKKATSNYVPRPCFWEKFKSCSAKYIESTIKFKDSAFKNFENFRMGPNCFLVTCATRRYKCQTVKNEQDEQKRHFEKNISSVGI